MYVFRRCVVCHVNEYFGDFTEVDIKRFVDKPKNVTTWLGQVSDVCCLLSETLGQLELPWDLFGAHGRRSLRNRLWDTKYPSSPFSTSNGFAEVSNIRLVRVSPVLLSQLHASVPRAGLLT